MIDPCNVVVHPIHADSRDACSSHRLPTLQRAHQAFNQQLAQCRRATEAASAEDSTQRQQLREAEVALEAALKARLSVIPALRLPPLVWWHYPPLLWRHYSELDNGCQRRLFDWSFCTVLQLCHVGMQAVQDTQRGAQAASRSVTTLQSELRDLNARQGRLTPHADWTSR